MSTRGTSRHSESSPVLKLLGDLRGYLEAIEEMRRDEGHPFCPFPIDGKVVDSSDGSHLRHPCQLANLEAELFGKIGPRLLEPAISSALRSVKVPVSEIFKLLQQYCELFRRSEWFGSRAESAPALPLYSRFLRDRILAVLDRAAAALEPEVPDETPDVGEAQRPSTAAASTVALSGDKRFLIAGQQFERAKRNLQDRGTATKPKDCYQWLKENPEPDEHLPAEDSWLRYVREYMMQLQGRMRHRRIPGYSRSAVPQGFA